MELDDAHLVHTSYDDIMGAEASSDDLAAFFANMRNMFDDE